MRLVEILEAYDPIQDKAKVIAQEWAESNGITLSKVVLVGSWGKRKYSKDIDLAATSDKSPEGLSYHWQMAGGYPVDLFLMFNGAWFAPHGGVNGAVYHEIEPPKFARKYQHS